MVRADQKRQSNKTLFKMIPLASKIIMFAVIASLFGGYAFNAGKNWERGRWEKSQAKAQAKFAEMVQQVSDMKDKDANTLVRVINDRESEIDRMRIDLASLGRLRISKAVCNPATVPGKAKGASVPDGKETVDLPTKIERDLRELINELEIEVLNCNTLRDIVAPHVIVVR